MAYNVLSTPTNSLLGSPEIRKDSFTPLEEADLATFPLKSYTNDISLLQNSKVVDQLFNDDGRLFLELLEVCCSGKGIAEIASKFKDTSLPTNLVNRLDRYQDASPLHYACINGHLEVVRYLVEILGADVDIWDGQKRVTPLICAAAYGHLPVVSFLLEHGCDVNAGLNETATVDTGKARGSALLWAVKRDHPPVIQCLLENNGGQNSTVLYSETPLHAAVAIGSSFIVEMLLRHKEPSKVDVHMGPRRDTPLHLAARGEFPNSVETCRILLQMGNVSVNEVNANGKTALHLAAAANNHEIIKQLLSHWASVDVQDKNGRTPLFHMISDATEALKSLDVLIFRGKCNVNHQDMYGYTALHLAGSRMAERAAEILLMSGADFSLKAVGGVSALSILQRKIPNTPIILRKAFDQAVTISQPGNTPNDISNDGGSGRQECKIKVNFKYVLPSPPLSSYALGNDPVSRNKEKTTRYPRMATIFFADKENEENFNVGERKETAKVKCLVEEDLSSLLLHPVVHAFLDMKWEKARPILLPAVLFKVAFVMLFSIYVELPYWMREDVMMINVTSTSPQNGKMIKEASLWFTVLYYILIAMVSLKGLMELTHFLRAPKIQWKSLEHWISLTVLLILIINLKPSRWANKSQKTYHRSMAALGILLAWIDIWINMSQFPKLGLSIRVFFQVFKNFTSFILPHICLLAGFVLSLTLLFHESGEFSQVPLTMTKLIRIMAGDITITGQGMTAITPITQTKEAITHYLLVYIYTAFVLMVAIVLMNLLIGLAVNDIQGIYAEASINKLVKQTILLNTLESSFKGPLIRFCLPKQFQGNYINLFKTGSENKTVIFKPFDSRDQKISTELKQALLNTENATVTGGNQNSEDSGVNDEALSSPNVRVWKNAVTKLIQKKDDDHKILMDKINELVCSYLAEKNRK